MELRVYQACRVRRVLLANQAQLELAELQVRRGRLVPLVLEDLLDLLDRLDPLDRLATQV